MGLGLFSRPSPPSAPQVAAPPPPPPPEPEPEEAPTADAEEQERRRRRARFANIRTGPLGAGAPEQPARTRLLGA